MVAKDVPFDFRYAFLFKEYPRFIHILDAGYGYFIMNLYFICFLKIRIPYVYDDFCELGMGSC